MSLWFWLFVLLVWIILLVAIFRSEDEAATTLGGKMVGPSLQERNARQADN